MKRLIIISSTFLLLAGVAAALYFSLRKVDKSEYTSIKVGRGNLKVVVSTTGTVRPQNRLQIKPTLSGRIEKALVNEGESVKRGQVLALLSSTDRAALLDAVRARSESQTERWEEVYKPMSVRAPIDGDIIARNIEPGQTVNTSDALFVMADRLIVQAQVDETDIGRIKPEQPVELSLDAYPAETITGRVDTIAYEAQTVNNVTMYMVDIVPNQVPPYFRSGMTANIQIITAVTNNALLLPLDVVVTKDKGSFVRQPKPDNGKKNLHTKVTTGLSDGKMVEIKSGLNEGDLVLKPLVRLPDAKNGGSNPFSPFQRKK